MRQNNYLLKIDSDFEQVLEKCAELFSERNATWITDELKSAFISLHEMGYAHSFEVWDNNELIGGLYGLSLGTQFSGESMFHRVSDASKMAFVFLSRVLENLNFDFVDCQVPTSHLMSLGACTMEKSDFLSWHKEAVHNSGRIGKWNDLCQSLNLARSIDLI